MENENKPSNGQQTSANQPSAPKIAIAPPQTKENCRDTERNKNSLKDPLFWLLFGTLIATGTAAYFTGRQATTAEDQEKRQLRAYIGLKRSEHVITLVCPDCDIPVFDPQTGFLPRNSFQMFLKNFGTTPAFHIRLCAGLTDVPLKTDLPTNIVISTFKECDNAGPVKGVMPTIWPTEERPYSVPLRASDVQVIRNAKARISDAFFYARIEYDDIFKIRQKSYICYVFAFVEGQGSLAGCGNEFVWDDEDGSPQK